MKKYLTKIVSLCLVACLAFSGCSKKDSSSDNASSTNETANSGTETGKDATSINICIASEPETIDPALNSSVDGGTLILHAFAGLVSYDTNGELQPDCAEDMVEGVENADGTVTYTYTLREGLKWSDGVELKASDFVYAWNRAVNPETGADYEYMFSVIKGYEDGNLDVVADDAARTLTITLYNKCNYWDQLLAFPTYLPVRQDMIGQYGDAWATAPASYVTNGAYTLTTWNHDSNMVYQKNPNYWNADAITMDTINFYLSDDASNMYANFLNKTFSMIDDVPLDEIASLKESSDEFHISGQLGTYYIFINENLDLLPNFTGNADEKEVAMEEVRNAFSLLLDRNYIVESVAQGGQNPASSFVGEGITDKDGSDFSSHAGGNSYAGYWDTSADAYEGNIATAIDILKKYYTYDEASGKFTDVPAITYSYNTNTGHAAIAEYVQYCYSNYGITINLENMEWAVYQTGVQDGSVVMGRYGWLADYDDPMTFLDMWTNGNGNNSSHIGESGTTNYSVDLTEYGLETLSGTWADTYDKLIDYAKATTDLDTYYDLCHKAEDMIMSTGCVSPVYFYTDLYMFSKDYTGLVATPLGFKLFHFVTAK